MASSIPIQAFVDAAQSLPVIDARSPSEFRQGHISGADNLPLFNDKERAEIGTIYKQKGRDRAVKRGLEIIGPKMRALVEQAEQIAPQRKLLLHCWRGGMRSGSLAWLLETTGFEVQTLEKGYKAFRNFILDRFTAKRSVYILSGYTGSGKTQILHELGKLGEQIVDLEGLAHHKGSAFGHLGESEQPTGEQFQNLLGMAWYQTEQERPVWLEDESRFVGRRCIPQPFFKQMRSAPVFKIKVPKEERIKHLAKGYGHYPDEKLKESILHIKKRLGGLRTQQAIEALEEGDLEKAADYVLHYYDKAYNHQLQKRDDGGICTLTVEDHDPQAIARMLLERTAVVS
jgi:tRNA 2-selenouridine synthase